MTDKIVYFPFAPGLPYKVRRGKYIIPTIDPKSWDRIFQGRQVVLAAYGGFFETLFSFSIAEAINQLKPKTKIKWVGDRFYDQIRVANGLASSSDLEIDQNTLSKFPVPIFFDKKENLFINCLNNYRKVFSYAGEFRYNDKRAAVKQIFQNIMIRWEPKYLPTLRQECPGHLEKLAKLRKFDLQQPYILLIPDRTGWSDHDVSCLEWSLNEIRSFAAMVRASDYNLVIFSPAPEKYHGIKAFIPPFQLNDLLYLLDNAKVVLSKDVDFVLGASIVGNAKTISLPTINEFKIEKNRKFLLSSNEARTLRDLSPLKALEEL